MNCKERRAPDPSRTSFMHLEMPWLLLAAPGQWCLPAGAQLCDLVPPAQSIWPSCPQISATVLTSDISSQQGACGATFLTAAEATLKRVIYRQADCQSHNQALQALGNSFCPSPLPDPLSRLPGAGSPNSTGHGRPQAPSPFCHLLRKHVGLVGKKFVGPPKS